MIEDEDEAGSGATFIWRSADGQTWERVADGPMHGDAGAPGIIGYAERDGVLIVDVWSENGTYDMYRTEDALSWHKPTIPPIPDGDLLEPGGYVQAVAAGWIWWAPIGGDIEDNESPPLVWTSVDGDTWTPVTDWPDRIELMIDPSFRYGGSRAAPDVSRTTFLIQDSGLSDGAVGLMIMTLEP